MRNLKLFGKRALALVLTVLMLMSTIAVSSFSVFAEEATEYTVYFKDVKNWGRAFVYFGAYWDDYNTPSKGAGPADRGNQHKMTLVEGSDNVYKYTFTASTPNYSSKQIAFTRAGQATYDNFWKTAASYRGDFNYASGKMFVPTTTSSGTYNETKYYNEGSWVSFSEDSTFSVMNSADDSVFADLTKTGDTTYTATVEITDDMLADTYSFYLFDNVMSYRHVNAGGTITADAPSVTTTNTKANTSTSVFTFTPSIAGEYTFTFNYALAASSGSFVVTYPLEDTGTGPAIDMTDRSLYLIGPNFGADITDTNYPLQVIPEMDYLYWYQGIPRDLLMDSNGTFYFSDGTTAIGAAANTILADTDSNENGSYYTDNDSYAIVGESGTFICQTIPAAWNYVNITVDTNTGQVWLFEAPKRDFDISDAVAELYIEAIVTEDETESVDPSEESSEDASDPVESDPVESDPAESEPAEESKGETSTNISYDSSVTLYAYSSGILRDGEPFTGNVTYNFYEMLGGTLTPSADLYLGSVTTNTGEAQITVNNINADSTFYVVVAPASTPSASFFSNMANAYVADELIIIEDVDIYYDFDTNVVDEPVYIYTMENDGTTTSTQMTKLEGTNIYTCKVDASYFMSNTGEINSNFAIYKVTMGDVEVGLKDEDQPDINKVMTNKTIWYKTTGTVSDNFVAGDPFEYDDDITLDRNDIPGYVNAYELYDTVRVYITDVYGYQGTNSTTSDALTDPGLAIRSGATVEELQANEFEKMSLVAFDNQYGQDYYYFDIPTTANFIQFKGIGNASFKANSTTTLKAQPNYEFPIVELSADLDSDSDNAYYMDWDGQTEELFYDITLWPAGDNPHAPKLVSYYSHTNTTKGIPTSVMPSEFYATLHVSLPERDYYDAEGNLIGTDYLPEDAVTSIYDADGTHMFDVEVISGTYTLGDKSYTGIVDIIVTGYVTGADNMLHLLFTPEGDLHDTYTPTDTTVQFYNKDLLRNALANALEVINDQAKTPHYTGETFQAVSDAYYQYFNVYMSSFDQDEIDAAAQAVIDALNALVPIEVADPSWFDIISYKSAVITFTHNGYGLVTKPVTRGYVQTINNGYSVLYAAYDGTASFPFTASDTATQTLAACPFMYWSGDSSAVITDKNVQVVSPAYGDTAYLAYFQPQDTYPVKVVYHYNVYSPEDSRTYEYVEGYTVPATYTSAIVNPAKDKIDIEANWPTIVVGMAPTLVNNYFDYELDMSKTVLTDYYNEDAGEGEDLGYYQFDAYFTETPHQYTVSVNGRATGETYHFQQIVDIDASAYTNASNVYWYNMTDSSTAISTRNTYSVRVTENLELGVAENINNLDVLFTSSITNAYTEITYDANQNKKLHQNFYIQNFIDANDDTVKYIGSGVFYYAFNNSTGAPVKSQVTSSVLNNLSNYALSFADKTVKTSGTSYVQNYKSTGLAYSYIPITDDWLDYSANYTDVTFPTWDAYGSGVVDYRGITDIPYPEEVIVRYSSKTLAFNYFFDAVNTYNSSLVDVSYKVYSFYLYEDANGEVQVVLCANPATAACYVTDADILGQ